LHLNFTPSPRKRWSFTGTSFPKQHEQNGSDNQLLNVQLYLNYSTIHRKRQWTTELNLALEIDMEPAGLECHS